MDQLSQLTNRPLSSLSIPPSTLSALLKAGYETVQDLDTSNAEQLANDLSIPLPSSQAIFSQRKTQRTRGAPLTQPASAVASSSVSRISTKCAPIDKLLGGGLLRRHVLEISGPPGTPKGAIALGIVKSFLKDSPDEEVVFMDTQNMTTASALRRAIPPDTARRVSHHVLHTLPELVVFVHTLPSILASRPKLGLLVLSSLHFPLQASKKLTIPIKNTVMENIKQKLVQVASHGVTIVITSQTATKLLAADGSPATFDTGVRAVMVPQLGPAYLPSSISFRVLICPQARESGVFRLLSEPSKPKQTVAPLREEPYTIPKRRMLPVSDVTSDLFAFNFSGAHGGPRDPSFFDDRGSREATRLIELNIHIIPREKMRVRFPSGDPPQPHPQCETIFFWYFPWGSHGQEAIVQGILCL
ncbi:Rad51 domain-containing protein [Mycena venus]|uniref:Rad51 domain-containing protein n=1 Tax=Mycena venus TaxID=2733690 RepID=A0A8H6YKD3_9AGAR|nr:Rad51 domain-containing protein [Mycena venus]